MHSVWISLKKVSFYFHTKHKISYIFTFLNFRAKNGFDRFETKTFQNETFNVIFIHYEICFLNKRRA